MPASADGRVACTKLLSLSSVRVETTLICSLDVFAAALAVFPRKQVRLFSAYVQRREGGEVEAAALGVRMCGSRTAESIE